MVTRVRSVFAVVVAALVLVVLVPAAPRADRSQASDVASDVPGDVPSDVTVHEWGTFTTVAGEDGRAVDWLPLGGPVDLPCFVHSFNRIFKVLAPVNLAVPDYTTARRTLRGKVRMETPVLYFYATRPSTVDVLVRFDKGMFTEWYPDAVANLPAGYPSMTRVPPGMTEDAARSSIFWKDVRILPGVDGTASFARELRPSHYYAARETDAAVVEYKREREKFLFYRGVAAFESPIAATIADSGMVTIANVSGARVPHVMLFTRQGTRHGFRVIDGLSVDRKVTIDRPAADRSLADVTQEIERTLVAQGLFVKEAQAMIETWRDSWFEDGTRVFYIVPPSVVDRVLPLDIDPKPASIVRVFVGRAELINASDITVVATALANKDARVLDRYGRLLGPIADRVLARTSDWQAEASMRAQLDAMLKAYAERLGACGTLPPAPPTEITMTAARR